MFLIIKHKNSCFFFLDEPTRAFLFFTFFSVILFFFMDVFILHLSRVFSFSIFLVCFHYSTFSGAFFFDLSRYFIFHRFRVLLCCCTAIATDLRKLFLLSGVFYLTLLPHICHSTASSTDLRELFFPLRRFLPYTLSRHFAQPALIKAFLGASSSWRLQGLPLRFETQTRSICLIESESVQQKLLVDRLYLCIKALRNTISISSRFWTHCLIACICIEKRILYPLYHRSTSCS